MELVRRVKWGPGETHNRTRISSLRRTPVVRNEGRRGIPQNSAGGVMGLVSQAKCSRAEGPRDSAMGASRKRRAVRDDAQPRNAAGAVSGAR